MKENPLLGLGALGQSIWIDFIHRGMFPSGELKRLIEDDGVKGVTSNPSIFEKAIAGTHEYDDDIRSLASGGKSAVEIYDALTVHDVQMAADLFRGLYENLQGKDGFMSLEVSPLLAHDTDGTVAEARRLWKAIDRPNAFIKVPATREGLSAITKLIGEGINVNVTLLFGLPRYREVAEAYIAGLEMLAGKNKPLDRVASVASFFLSRIDTLVDPMLDKKRSAGGPGAARAEGLRGQVACASAKVAYRMYKDIFAGERFMKLAARGARTQRLLWASTGAKDPAYSDVKYIDTLIGPETVNTVPRETLDAYREHGDPALRLESGIEEAGSVIEQLPALGIDLAALSQQLEDDGVAKFSEAYARLMDAIVERRKKDLAEAARR